MSDFSSTLTSPNWPTKTNWVDLIMPDFYQQGLAILTQAIPADLCQALLTEVQQHTDLTAAGVGRAGQLQQNSDIRRDHTASTGPLKRNKTTSH
jgi:hypothetical protein